MSITAKMPHQLLKQAPPFLFIDRIVEKNENKIKCIKHLTYNESFFAGHFPGQPIVPGVLMIEMAAQASMLLALDLEKESRSRIGYLVQTKDFKFYQQGKPGDSLYITTENKESFGRYMTFKVLITIGDEGKKAAKGELVFFLPEGD
ncbi:3-hydroxyacyl-ACP dehydratase FabZ family protein [Metabacillus fastidiosus]|uniref:3-hydroxyacyl-ACP dehydratase FabZ family protein n=1 Tax=Metabacillus fastidiosus TaxID=1458 RepID=UPI003D2802AA